MSDVPLETFKEDVDEHASPALTENKYYKAVWITLCVTLIVHFISLTLLFRQNQLMYTKYIIDYFPYIQNISPFFISFSQSLISSLILTPFCIKEFISNIHDNVGGIFLTTIPYICSITSSLGILSFANPPPYYNLRSISICLSFFIGFFRKQFYNWPNMSIACGFMIVGTVLSYESHGELFYPYLFFGLQSSLSVVIYSYLVRRAIGSFRRKFLLLVYSMHVVSALLLLPFAIIFTDFTIFTNSRFPLGSFIGAIFCSGILSTIASCTTVLIVYMTSPLQYTAISTARQSVTQIVSAIIYPIDKILEPAQFAGHLLCIFSAIMVTILHLNRIRYKTAIPWEFPKSILKVFGIISDSE